MSIEILGILAIIYIIVATVIICLLWNKIEETKQIDAVFEKFHPFDLQAFLEDDSSWEEIELFEDDE